MKNKIIFTTDVPGLEDFKDIHPKPSNTYIPKWYKNLKSDIKVDGFNSKVIPNMKTVKLCPSFSEVFREGFIMFAPCDIYFRLEPNGLWEWKTSDTLIKCDVHEDEQMVQHLDNKKVKKVFKIISPFKAITPKGWSIRQVPLFYDFNEDWQVAYGILNTDVEHELNQQILFTSNKNEVLIKRGDPLNYIIPFKRNETLSYDFKPLNKKLKQKIDVSRRLVSSSFRTAKPYYKKSK